MPDLTFRSLASSSKGNAYLVSDGETVLLLECGLPYKKLAEKSGFTLMDTAACFVTHEHNDHSHAAAQLIKRGVPVFMSEGTARALELWDAEIIEPNVPIMVGAFRVMPFRVAHDAADPVGYLIDDTRTGERMMFAADTRSLSYIIPRLTYIAIECNYEESLLAASQRIPESLKNRIRHSHFEVEDVIRWLKKQDLSHVLTIYLLHLSAGNSRAAAWQQMFAREFPGIDIQICKE